MTGHPSYSAVRRFRAEGASTPNSARAERLPAVVMNMFYTGLGIARSLGAQGIPIIGLSAQRGLYGNFTRYADVRHCPDSREDPERLLEFLHRLAGELGKQSVIFPTRDDDVLFLDRYRDQLRSFIPVVPSTPALQACLNKWETHVCAKQAGVRTPRCWKLENMEDVARIPGDVVFPCVLKPLSSHYWRKAGNWERVGARKAIGVTSRSALIEEYTRIARADHRAVLQEMVPGGDDQLFIAACYMAEGSQLLASFTAQKLVQIPQGFGTGCIVQTAERPELLGPTVRLLETMRFTGIAEVEYKWDSTCSEYKLIEVNPRPWDQHRLGHACGADLIHTAYCDYAGLAAPASRRQPVEYKWVAEDVFLQASLRSLWRRDGKLRSLWRLARGRRIYGIWSADDPIPSIACTATFLARMVGAVLRRLGSLLSRRRLGKHFLEETNPS